MDDQPQDKSKTETKASSHKIKGHEADKIRRDFARKPEDIPEKRRAGDNDGNRYFIYGGLALVALVVGIMFLNNYRTANMADIAPAAGEEANRADN